MSELERKIVELAMARYAEWKEENPEGLLPLGHPRALRGIKWSLVEACMRLEEARKP